MLEPGDDLDDLLNSLDSPAPKQQPKTAFKQSTKSVKKDDDLDDLLNDLDAKPKAKPTVMKGDDLDDLLNDLEEKPKPKQTPVKTQVKAAPKPVQKKDDLDDLLNDLDAPAPKKTPAKPVQKKDDLDDLLNDLDAPTQKKQPAKQKDDLDDLLNDLDTPAPKKQATKHKDDLDDLLDGLDEVPKKQSGKKGDDLDDLLNGLDTPVKPKKGDDLDDLLDGLNEAPKKQPAKSQRKDELDDLLDGIDAMPTKNAAAPAPVAAVISDPNACAECGRPLQAQRITAIGRNYHPNCFVCRNCKTPIGANPFHAIDNYPYCKQCYLQRFAKMCARCGKPITDQCLNALGKSYHQACFNCTRCHKPFATPSFFQKDGEPYCEVCYKEAVAVKCGGCGKPIVGNSLMALGNKYHPECFVCSVCKAPFPRGQFFNLGGKPVCAEHKNGAGSVGGTSVCAHCNKPIVAGNSFISAMGKKFHSNHFMCSFCVTPLTETSFKENMGKPYCFSCHGKLFG
ncbi:MAG: hypothetical protein J6A51_03835 [Clostridia bacterium]|nr:hypothetical protein [Clostridia bacterium]